ncbi:MAG: glutamate--tRNA ligase [Chloroflexi bacterium]|nr:glutamate--tRNA ligase [Chloroflexota bacterium]
MSVRVRYAPSPTGTPHVGNIRTALFNWLFARNQGGQFIVRIEDTDVERLVSGALEAILESLRWLGLNWDEGPEVGGPCGPYIQSQRLSLYHEHARRLVAEGQAYHCYCSPQRLTAMREEQQRQKRPSGYDRRCRELTPQQRAEYETQGIKSVVRFKAPLDGQTTFSDLIRDEVTFAHSTLDDLVLLKSDGYPTYHLANVVDDHLMGITHVMRAEEWLPSTPRHVLLYDAFGWQPPQFAHLPMILGPDRSKLSKRHGATSLLEYRDQGYLPEAMMNFLALLGWSLDDKTETIDRDMLVQHFSIERVGKPAAIFHADKLLWMNGVYMRQLSPQEWLKRALPFLDRDLPPELPRPLPRDYLAMTVPLVQDRAKTLAEIAGLVDFFLVDELTYEATLLHDKGLDVETSRKALGAALDLVSSVAPFDAETLEAALRPLAEQLGLKTGTLFGILRVATTGRTAAPPLFATMAVLGRERCLKRLETALNHLA